MLMTIGQDHTSLDVSIERRRIRPKFWANLPFIGVGGAFSRGHWRRAASEVGGKPGLNSQAKKGLNEESVSAESKAAESSNKIRTKNGPDEFGKMEVLGDLDKSYSSAHQGAQ